MSYAADGRRAESPLLTQRLISDSVRYALAKVLPTVAGVATVVLASRILGTAEFGRYSIILVTAVLLRSILYGWIRQSVLRYLPSYQEAGTLQAKSGDVHNLSLIAAAMIGAASVPILVVQGFPALLSLLGGLFVASTVAFRHIGTVQQAVLHSAGYAVLTSTQALLHLLLLLVFLVPALRNVEVLVAVSALAYAGAVLLGVSSLRNYSFELRLRLPRWPLIRSYFAYGAPLAGWFFMTQVLNVGDQYIIQWLRGPDEVGVYAAAYTIANKSFAVLTMPVLLAMHPLIMKAWEETRNREDTARLLRQAAKLYSLGTVPLVGYFFLASDLIVRVTLGPEFWGGAAIMGIVALGFWALGVAQYVHKGLEIAGRTQTMFMAATVSAVANVALNFAFIPKYGFIAAAYTTVFSMVAYLTIAHYHSRRHLPWRFPVAEAVKIVLATAGATALTFQVIRILETSPVLVQLTVSMIIFTAAYVAALIPLRVVAPAQLVRAARKTLGGRATREGI